MTISKEEQVAHIAPFLKKASFKKKGNAWQRIVPDGVHVVNFQGSQWGPEYYLNLGVYLRALGAEVTPPEFRCHVRSRIHEPDRDPEILFNEIELWFSANGSIEALSVKQATNSLPNGTSIQAANFLMQHNQGIQEDATKPRR